jgi:hypothetical protein
MCYLIRRTTYLLIKKIKNIFAVCCLTRHTTCLLIKKKIKKTLCTRHAFISTSLLFPLGVGFGFILCYIYDHSILLLFAVAADAPCIYTV